MKLLSEKEIEEAAKDLRKKECSEICDNYTNGLSVGIEFGFEKGALFTQQKLTPLFVEAIEWAVNGDHCWSNDAFCIGENRNKWHDDDGTFITTEQLLEQFIEQRNK